MISLLNVNKTFQVGDQPLHVLKDINLNIGQGDYLSIMGPSGSGKSTLLNVLGLLDVMDSGSYQLEDVAVESLDEEQKARVRSEKLGFIFQSFHLVSRLTAAENIELPLMLAEIPKAERAQRIAQVLEQVGLVDRANHLPNQLSGGQLQRVAIARAIILQPKLILADEPTGNLDSGSGKGVVETLEQLNASGITLIVVTHDKDLGDRAKRQLKMLDGRMSEIGKPA